MHDAQTLALSATTGVATPGAPSREDMRLAQALAHVMEDGVMIPDDEDEE